MIYFEVYGGPGWLLNKGYDRIVNSTSFELYWKTR